eukprot:symbB.v1.2.034575.t1/scaffold4489.1/size39059/1
MEEEQSNSFLEVMEVMEERVKVMSMMQETRQMLQAKERGELVGLVNEEECRAKVMALQQCVDSLRKFPESPRNLESPRPDVSQAGTLDTEYTEDQEGEDEEEEGPVDESLELFLREAWREEMVEFIRTIKKEFKKCQQEKQNLEFEMQELREDNSRRERESMEEKRKLRAKVGNLQCKLNALTGKNGGSPGGSSGSGGSSPPKPPVSKVSIETQTEPEVVGEDVDVSNVEIKPWTNDEMLKVLKKMQMERAVREANAPKKVTDLELGRDVKDAFSKRAGTNIQLSKDHMIATRVDEVQSQAVVFGSSPIRKEAFGWYYSVEVKAMTSRIWGGLAVGVTQIRPRSFQELPNKEEVPVSGRRKDALQRQESGLSTAEKPARPKSKAGKKSVAGQLLNVFKGGYRKSISHRKTRSERRKERWERHKNFERIRFDMQVEADPFANRLRVTRRPGDESSNGNDAPRDSESAPLGSQAYHEQLRCLTGGNPGKPHDGSRNGKNVV